MCNVVLCLPVLRQNFNSIHSFFQSQCKGYASITIKNGKGSFWSFSWDSIMVIIISSFFHSKNVSCKVIYGARLSLICLFSWDFNAEKLAVLKDHWQAQKNAWYYNKLLYNNDILSFYNLKFSSHSLNNFNGYSSSSRLSVCFRPPACLLVVWWQNRGTLSKTD